MMNLNSDEYYFAESVDCIVAIGDFEAFVNKNRKLYELHRMLTKCGIHCDYEYAYHDGDEVIPGIIFPKNRNDGETIPGLPGIMVASKNEELYLFATSCYSVIEQAIEFEVPVKDNDTSMFVDYDEELDYFRDIFSTKSVLYMYNYINALYSIIIGGHDAYIIPFAQNKVATYWTKIFSDGTLSYDRLDFFEFTIPEKGKSWEGWEMHIMTIDEEKMLSELYACFKKIVSDVQQSYKKLLNDKK